jgi:hypothetical protein
MRIGATFTAVLAITLVAAVGVHSDSSGLTEQVARSAQPRQLAQAPESAPPPTGQPGPENPPSTAPPPATTPPNPSPGTPAMVLDDQEVSIILGKSVRSWLRMQSVQGISCGEQPGSAVSLGYARFAKIRATIPQ